MIIQLFILSSAVQMYEFSFTKVYELIKQGSGVFYINTVEQFSHLISSKGSDVNNSSKFL